MFVLLIRHAQTYLHAISLLGIFLVSGLTTVSAARTQATTCKLSFAGTYLHTGFMNKIKPPSKQARLKTAQTNEDTSLGATNS
jgi:hypothetical protein